MANGLFNLKQQLQGLIQKAWGGSQTTPYVEYLVVAGGGGANNGGGGAGGLLQGIVPITTGSAITVTIGGGGNGAVSYTSNNGANGQNSVFGSITAIGGGGGGDQTGASAGGSNGGSGGGQGFGRTTASNYYVGQGVAGQGNAGSLGYSDLTTYTKGGGGGGAGTVSPFAGNNNVAGNGGAGIASGISGTATDYAGGGGGATVSSGVQSFGGVGGGGAGVYSGNGTSGTPNTGGGGGGTNSGSTGGNGGSGIVIISYPDIYNAPASFGGANSPTASTSGSGSLSFTGSTDNVYAPNNSAFAVGTSNFTIEFWANWTTWSGTDQRQIIMGQSGSTSISIGRTSSADALSIDMSSGNKINYSWTPTLNTWYHIALVRSGTGSNQLVLYINGTSVATGTSSDNVTANNFFVGGLNWASGYSMKGYMSNVRFVNGTAVYTSNFTPSTIPLKTITNTALMLNTVSGSQFIDSSTNSFTIVVSGTPSWNQLSPFATGLGYKNRVYTWTGSGTVTF